MGTNEMIIRCLITFSMSTIALAQLQIPPQLPPQMMHILQGIQSQMLQMPSPVPGVPFAPQGSPLLPVQVPMMQRSPYNFMQPFPNFHQTSQSKHKKRSMRKKQKPNRRSYDDRHQSESGERDYHSREVFKPQPKGKRREVLTPVISYVTKDGYVVYQKKIKSDKARDWLSFMARGKENKVAQSGELKESNDSDQEKAKGVYRREKRKISKMRT